MMFFYWAKISKNSKIDIFWGEGGSTALSRPGGNLPKKRRGKFGRIFCRKQQHHFFNKKFSLIVSTPRVFVCSFSLQFSLSLLSWQNALPCYFCAEQRYLSLPPLCRFSFLLAGNRRCAPQIPFLFDFLMVFWGHSIMRCCHNFSKVERNFFVLNCFCKSQKDDRPKTKTIVQPG